MHDPDTSPTDKEATRLAEEALAEIRDGETEDGEFVLEEARRLDPDAVEKVVHKQHGRG